MSRNPILVIQGQNLHTFDYSVYGRVCKIWRSATVFPRQTGREGDFAPSPYSVTVLNNEHSLTLPGIGRLSPDHRPSPHGSSPAPDSHRFMSTRMSCGILPTIMSWFYHPISCQGRFCHLYFSIASKNRDIG